MLVLPSGECEFSDVRVNFCNIIIPGLWYGSDVDTGTAIVYASLLQVIATYTFSVLFLRLPVKRKRNIAWIVIVGNWSLLFAIVIAGPATASIQKDGPYCEYSQYGAPFQRFLTTTLQTES